MFCPNCGTKIKPGAAFCPSCGKRISSPEPQEEKREPRELVPVQPAYEDPTGPDESMSDQDKEPYVMKENRSLVLLIVLTIVTCFFYQFYYVYSIAKDVNLACEGDGEETSGLLKFILFSLITCGIYSLYWYYKFLNRIQANGLKYGYSVKRVGNMDLGAGFLVLFFVGFILSFFCLIGLVVSLYNNYLILQNLNAMAKCYNERMSAGSSNVIDTAE